MLHYSNPVEYGGRLATVSPGTSGCICAPPCINPAKKPTDPAGTCPPCITCTQKHASGISPTCDISPNGKLPVRDLLNSDRGTIPSPLLTLLVLPPIPGAVLRYHVQNQQPLCRRLGLLQAVQWPRRLYVQLLRPRAHAQRDDTLCLGKVAEGALVARGRQ